MATLAQARNGTVITNPQTLAYTSNVTMGNLLVVQVREGSATVTDPIVSDSIGNTFALAQRTSRSSVFLCKTISGGANTVSLSSSAATCSMVIFEFNGIWDDAPVITAASSTTDNSSPVTAPSVSPSAANGVTLACVSANNASNPFAATSPYTLGPVALNQLVLAYDFPTTTTGRTTDITTGSGISGGAFVQHLHIAEASGPSPAALARYRKLCKLTK